MNSKYQSRLNRQKISKGKRNLWLSVITMCLLSVLFVKYGIPFLSNATLFLSSHNATKQTQASTTSMQYVSPPTLNDLPTATNKSTITISGSGEKGQKIYLYQNNQQIANLMAKDDGSFSFSYITLETGSNTFYAVAKEGVNQSTSSNNIVTTYTKKGPTLTIDSPTNHQVFSDPNSKQITVRGKTDPNATVNVNGYIAIVNGNGTYTYNMQLNDGENTLTVEATDNAGNKTTLTRTVTYSQPSPTPTPQTPTP